MNRLLEIGFEPSGHWVLEDDKLTLELNRHSNQRNILYAFVSDGEVMYVGKTVQTLTRRLYGYVNPGGSQTTNLKNHALLVAMLRKGAAVDVFALPDDGLLHYGQFHLNLAAGLEDSIIKVIGPSWNGAQQFKNETDEADHVQKVRSSFSFVLRDTYFDRGFFNVPIRASAAFGGDEQVIEIYCGDSSLPIAGVINRRHTPNGAPRIMGSVVLRDWFQAHVKLGSELTVDVYSPTSIRIF